MIDIQQVVVDCKQGRISEDELLKHCNKLIRKKTMEWWRKIGDGDGITFEEKEQLCTIWCWEAFRSYDAGVSKFTTYYYNFTKNRMINVIKEVNSKRNLCNKNAYSYEFEFCEENESNVVTKYGQIGYRDDYTFELEMCLDREYSGLPLHILTCKVKNPQYKLSEVARVVGCSKVYVSDVWSKAKPKLLKILYT